MLSVSVFHSPTVAIASVLLDFSELGWNAGNACPVVMAAATLNGQPMTQNQLGGPYPCDDPPCMRPAPCVVPSWTASFPGAFPPSPDGMLTFELTDSGAPARMVSALDLWADTTVSDVKSPSAPGELPQATLSVAPRPPYTAVGDNDDTDHNMPLVGLLFHSDGGREYLLKSEKTGAPNTFRLSISVEPGDPPVTAGELDVLLFFGVSKPPTPVCAGVQYCMSQTSTELPPIGLSFP